MWGLFRFAASWGNVSSHFPWIEGVCEMEFVIALIGVAGFIGLATLMLRNDPPPTQRHEPPEIQPYRPVVPDAAPVPAPQEPLNLPPIPPGLELTGKVYVIDGDTIRIGKTKIRLAGIDAPEVDMPWGQKLKWAMVDICKGRVIITAKLDGNRSYDRFVGTCYLSDGSDIAAEIVSRGLALDLPAFSGGKYRMFETAEGRKRLRGGMFGHRSLAKKN